MYLLSGIYLPIGHIYIYIYTIILYLVLITIYIRKLDGIVCRGFNPGAVCCNCHSLVIFADISTLVASHNVGYFHLVRDINPNVKWLKLLDNVNPVP